MMCPTCTHPHPTGDRCREIVSLPPGIPMVCGCDGEPEEPQMIERSPWAYFTGDW